MLNNCQQLPVSPIPYSPAVNPQATTNPSRPKEISSDVYESSIAQKHENIPKQKDNSNLYLGLGIGVIATIATIGLYALTKGKTRDFNTNRTEKNVRESLKTDKKDIYTSKKMQSSSESIDSSHKKPANTFKPKASSVRKTKPSKADQKRTPERKRDKFKRYLGYTADEGANMLTQFPAGVGLGLAL